MLVKTVTTVVATNSIGQPVDAIPVRQAVAGETDIIGRPVDVIAVEESEFGVPVRYVTGKAAQNSAGQWVDTIAVQGGGVPVTPQIQLSNASIPESAASGSQVGVLSVSNGTGTWSFTKTADPDSKFAVSGANLNLAAAVDFETKTSHSVTIQAANGTDTISRTFSISVANALEGTLGPTAASFTAGTAAGTLIAAITGLDVGANETIESITPNDGRLALDVTRRNVIVGLSAASAGAIAATLTTSAGRTLLMSITVNSSAPSEVPWTPAMLASATVFGGDVSDQSTVVASGSAISAWNDKYGPGNHAVQATAARQPVNNLLETKGSKWISTVENATSGNEDGLVTPACFVLHPEHTIVAMLRLRPVSVARNRTLLGYGNSGFAVIMNQSGYVSSAHTFDVTGHGGTPLIEDNVNTERPRLLAVTYKASLQSQRQKYYRNGIQVATAEALSSNLTLTPVTIGNVGGLSQGSNADWGFLGVYNKELTPANLLRLEGYIYHALVKGTALDVSEAGVAGEFFPTTHPYYTNPPTVPAGTTSTVDWIDVDTSASAARQTVMGMMLETSADSINGDGVGVIDDGTEDWGFPQSLAGDFSTPGTPAYRAAKELLSVDDGWGGRASVSHVRQADGIYRRGQTDLLNPGSGLYRNFVARFPEWDTKFKAMCDAAGIRGAYYMKWSLPGGLKINRGQSDERRWIQGGYPRAGGSYANTITLHSIRTSDPTQFAAQRDLIALHNRLDMEKYHQEIKPILLWSLNNEPMATTAYPSCSYGDDATFYEVFKACVKQILASAILSPGGVLSIKILGDAYAGYTGSGMALMRADTEVLANGLTMLQNFWGYDYHGITATCENPLFVPNNTAEALASGKKLVNGEQEWFDNFVAPYKNASGATAYYMDPGADRIANPEYVPPERRTTHTALAWINQLVTFDAPWVNFIHMGKPTHTAAFFERQGRALVSYRVPGRATASDVPDLAEGDWVAVGPNANPFRAFLRGLHQDFTRHLAYGGDLAAGHGVVAGKRLDGRWSIILVNHTDTQWITGFSIGRGVSKTMRGWQFDKDNWQTSLGESVGSGKTITIPARSGQVWVAE